MIARTGADPRTRRTFALRRGTRHPANLGATRTDTRAALVVDLAAYAASHDRLLAPAGAVQHHFRTPRANTTTVVVDWPQMVHCSPRASSCSQAPSLTSIPLGQTQSPLVSWIRHGWCTPPRRARSLRQAPVDPFRTSRWGRRRWRRGSDHEWCIAPRGSSCGRRRRAFQLPGQTQCQWRRGSGREWSLLGCRSGAGAPFLELGCGRAARRSSVRIWPA